jgi:hypothetical protein
MVGVDEVQRVARQGRIGRVGRILHDGDAAAIFDRAEAGDAVVAGAGQEHADHASGMDARRAAKQRIDGGPMPVFARACDHADVVRFDQQVPIGRRDVDSTGRNGFAVLRVRRAQRSRSVQDLRQDADRFGRDVDDDEDRRGEISGQSADELAQRFDAAG